MMKASQLRPGNYIEDIFNLEKRVKRKIDLEDLAMFINYGGVRLPFKPIELTEEILLKCGFQGNGVIFTNLKIGSVYLKKCYREADCFLVKSNGGDAITSLTYLHSLQNFFYSLTGEELQINL